MSIPIVTVVLPCFAINQHVACLLLVTSVLFVFCVSFHAFHINQVTDTAGEVLQTALTATCRQFGFTAATRLARGSSCSMTCSCLLPLFSKVHFASEKRCDFAGVVLALFGELFPGDESSPGCDTFNWVKLWLGFYLSNTILPCCMLYTYLSPLVEWGGIRYYKKQGKVKRLLCHAS